MASSVPRVRTSREDIGTLLFIAQAFHQRAEAIESRAVAAEKRSSAREKPRGATGSPSRDPRTEQGFVIELFGFVSALRTLREYIYAAVKGSAGQNNIRTNRLEVDIIVLHALLANQALHSAMLDVGSRVYYQGGKKHGRFAYIYVQAKLDGLAEPLFNKLQTAHEAATGSRLSILELGSLSLDSLKAIHSDCLTNGWY